MSNVNIIEGLIEQKDYTALVNAINRISDLPGATEVMSSADDPDTDLTIPELFDKLDAGQVINVCGKMEIANINGMKVTTSSETSTSAEDVYLSSVAIAITAYYNEYLVTKTFLAKFLRPAMFLNNKIDYENGQAVLNAPRVEDYDTVK